MFVCSPQRSCVAGAAAGLAQHRCATSTTPHTPLACTCCCCCKAHAYLVDLDKADFDCEVGVGLMLHAREQLVHDVWDDALVVVFLLWRPGRPHGVRFT